MSHARAAVAGMLVAVIAIWLHASRPQVERDEAIVALLLLGVVALLIVPDVAHQWRTLRDRGGPTPCDECGYLYGHAKGCPHREEP